MRRRRYQKGSVKIRRHGKNDVWVAQWWEHGRRRSRVLGLCKELSKSQAEKLLAGIVYPINSDQPGRHPVQMSLKQFVETVFFPLKRGKWKGSTAGTTEQRIMRFLLESQFADVDLRNLRRERLQEFLNGKANAGLSFSVVDHLRWDLNAIGKIAKHEGLIERNPAELLFTPRNAVQPEKPTMTGEEITKCLMVLDLRERLIVMIAIYSGLRPGEIFCLKLGDIKENYFDIVRGVYRGKIDSPKTRRSERLAAISNGTQAALLKWLEFLPDRRPTAWLFPSEGGETPLGKDNCWQRFIAPRFRGVGLEWVNFQAMRRTWSTISDREGVSAKVRADQMGHGVGVNVDVYTQTDLQQRLEAVNRVENAVLRTVME